MSYYYYGICTGEKKLWNKNELKTSINAVFVKHTFSLSLLCSNNIEEEEERAKVSFEVVKTNLLSLE